MSFSTTSTVPIDLLPGIGKRTAKVLRSLEIRTIGEFKTMPEKVLVELFGPSIRQVHQYVQGRTKSPNLHQQITTTKVSSKPRSAGKLRRTMKMASLMVTML